VGGRGLSLSLVLHEKERIGRSKRGKGVGGGDVEGDKSRIRLLYE
jgi:hypothetical protein